jgi:hypothetical protein
MPKHENNGACLKCLEIKNKYPNFHEPLWDWFVGVQKSVQDFHISCAGRGEDDQEALFYKLATKAHWTKSAHNWGCALDTFFLVPGSNVLWPRGKYDSLKNMGRIPAWLQWYGEPGCTFPELPHFEVRNWRSMRDLNQLTLCVKPTGAV